MATNCLPVKGIYKYIMFLYSTVFFQVSEATYATARNIL